MSDKTTRNSSESKSTDNKFAQNSSPDRQFGDETLCLHAGQIPDQVTGSRAPPIYQTTSYVFDDAEHAASLFNLQTFGNVYSRLTALAVASGMSAQMIALLTLVNSGDEIVAARTLYGGSFSQMDVNFKRLGIKTHFVDPDDPENFRKVITDKTRLLYGETLGNPNLNVLDIRDNGKFPEMVDASDGYHGVRFYETFGDFAFTMKARMEYLRTLGPSLSPFNAFAFLQGLETLHLRMERHVYNAMKVATFLSEHKLVEWVNYPGLEDSQYYALAQKYMPRGASAVLTFGIKGGFSAAEKFIDSAQFLSHLANIGDAKTLIVHPASTTHRQLNETQQIAAGVRPDMVRVSVGLESIEDILWDIDQALKAGATAR